MIRKYMCMVAFVIALLLPFTSMALGTPNIVFDYETGQVVVYGETNKEDINVNMIIEKDGKRYYIDSQEVDEAGYRFETILPPNMGKLNVTLTSIGSGPIKAVINTDEENNNGGGGGGGGTPPSNGKINVTLSVDKQTINKGYVINPVTVQREEGDTVWDLLRDELDDRGIAYEYSYASTYNSVYVESIDGDGEFDHGPGSGWMYNVNGIYPDYGASRYTLQDGDVVQWRYTTNLGEDLGTQVGGGGSNADNSVRYEPDLSGSDPVIDLPDDEDADFIIEITEEYLKKNSITINIPNEKSILKIDFGLVKDGLPDLKVVRGDAALHFPKGTRIVSGDTKLEILSPVANDDPKVLAAIGDDTVVVNKAIKIGSDEGMVLFDQLVTLTLEGVSETDQLGYISEGKFNPIAIYSSEEEGINAFDAEELVTFAYLEDGKYIIKTNHFTTFLSYQGQKGYLDVEDISEWAIEAVQRATKLGIIEGSNDGNFYPQASITRAEFTKLLIKGAGIEVEEEQQSVFNDIKEEDWYFDYINTAYQHGLVQGYGDTFRPNQTLTRQEMAVLIDRVVVFDNPQGDMSFEDEEQIASWAKGSVEAVHSHGIMLGDGMSFDPIGETTREMAVVVIMRTLDWAKDNQ